MEENTVIARMVHTEGGSRMPEGALANLNENVIPALKHQPGFVAAYWTVDEAGKGLGIILWEDEQSDAANEAKVAATRDETLAKHGRRVSKNEAHKVVAHSH